MWASKIRLYYGLSERLLAVTLSRGENCLHYPFWVIEFTVMPFGLHNAPATFNVWWIVCCYKDVRSLDKHTSMMLCLAKHGRRICSIWEQCSLLYSKQGLLTFKLPKCQFGLKEVKHLGHIIGEGQLRPDPEKLDAIQSYPKSVTKSQVNSFIGLVSYALPQVCT